MSPAEIKEDLQYIRQIIENNQRALIDNGVMFITNGICVLFGLALTVLIGSPGRDAFIPAIWVILVIIMVVLNHKLPQRIDPNLPQKTFASKLLQANFAATGFPMVILFLLFSFTDGLTFHALITAFSALFGVMFFMFGMIINLNMMKALALVWWGYMILFNFRAQIGPEWLWDLSFPFLIGLLQLIPGIIIYRKWKALYAYKPV